MPQHDDPTKVTASSDANNLVNQSYQYNHDIEMAPSHNIVTTTTNTAEHSLESTVQDADAQNEVSKKSIHHTVIGVPLFGLTSNKNSSSEHKEAK